MKNSLNANNYSNFSMEQALHRARRERSTAFHNLLGAALGFGLKNDTIQKLMVIK